MAPQHNALFFQAVPIAEPPCLLGGSTLGPCAAGSTRPPRFFGGRCSNRGGRGRWNLLVRFSPLARRIIVRDRLDYLYSMSDSWKRQTLMNLVKTRYADAPVFLDVASGITSYSWEAEPVFAANTAKRAQKKASAASDQRRKRQQLF